MSSIATSLITGITGFAGRHLSDMLRQRGERVYGFAQPAADNQLESAHLEGAELHHGDVRNADHLAELLSTVRPNTVYHLAALSHVGNSWEHRRATFEVNLLGTDAVLDAIARTDTSIKVVLVSSGQVYGAPDESLMPLGEAAALRPRSPYAASKLCAEVLGRQAADAGMAQVVIVRPFNFAGPGQDPNFVCSDFARQIAVAEISGHAELRVGNLAARRDFTDVRDTVRGFVAAAEHGLSGSAYNLCSGRGIAVQEVLDGLLRLSSADIRVEVDAERFRPVDVPLFIGDGALARTELGWGPEIALNQTLQETLAYWRREVSDDA